MKNVTHIIETFTEIVACVANICFLQASANFNYLNIVINSMDKIFCLEVKHK